MCSPLSSSADSSDCTRVGNGDITVEDTAVEVCGEVDDDGDESEERICCSIAD